MRKGNKEPSTPLVQGDKYLRLVGKLLQGLYYVGTERDQAGSLQLFYDQYATLLLLYVPNPRVRNG